MRALLPQVQPLRTAVIFVIPAFLLAFILLHNIIGRPAQQFSELAQSFSHGHLYFLHNIGGEGYDPVNYHGHQYWDDGPFPSIILIPFVALFSLFHAYFYQGYLDWAFIVGTAWFVYKLARHFRYATEDSLVWTCGFVLGSAFIGVSSVSSSWFYAQILTVFLLFWSLYEYFTARRWWLIGAICACLFLTRATAAAIVMFFGLELLRGTARKPGLARFLPLVIPLVGAIALQGLYNFLRFHSPINGGMAYQLVGPEYIETRKLGVFSPRHIPTNLYSLVLRAPVPVTRTSTSSTLGFPFIASNKDGISIFITSPYFLYLLGRKWSVFTQTARHLLVAALVACLGVLSFYGLGRDQIGYRYSLDFLPELFVVLMLVYRTEHTRLSRGMKFLLLTAGVFDFYLVLTAVFL